MKFLKTIGVGLFCAALAGCGGGGGTTDTLTGQPPSSGSSGGGTTPATAITMGATVNGAFQSGVIGLPANTTQLADGGSATLTVEFRNSTGPASETIEVSFASDCLTQGTATITPQNAAGVTSTNAVTVNGIATARYQNNGCALTQDAITARVAKNSGTATITPATATATIGIVPAQVGSIVFESATPTNIGLRGTGRNETSLVSFMVKTQGGGPKAGAVVSFALSTTVGGLDLVGGDAGGSSAACPTAGTRCVTTGADGRAQITVKSGTQATTVRVTATTSTASGPISTQSSQLTVTTGIPDADSMSLSASCFNIEGLEYDGTTATITARLADRFNNPVPDGTAVNFRTEGGRITPQCTTAGDTGLCTVTWESSAPRPADGRSSVLATAIGEETFRDANGDGIFNGTDGFVATTDGFVDRLLGRTPANDYGEPFLDENENGAYDAGEPFFDFNNSGSRNAQDGKYAGLLCGAGAACAAQSTTGIGDSLLIVMSGSTATFPNAPVNIDVRNQGRFQLALQVVDRNGNAMPGGTTVKASGSGFTLSDPKDFVVGCTTARLPTLVSGGNVFQWTVNGDTTPSGGTLTIEVKTPKGVTTLLQIPVLD